MTRLLSAQEAATMLGLAPQTLAIFRLNGQGPKHCKLGRRVLYDPADIQSWIDANKRFSTSPAVDASRAAKTARAEA